MNDEMANRIAQGIIIGLILTALFSIIFYILKRREKKNDIKATLSFKQSNYIQTYFLQTIQNKGFRRLIIVLGILLPLLLSIVICYNDAKVIENVYGETLRFYDESVFFTSFFLIFIAYWTLYAISIWIYKGFQESKK